MSDQTNVARRGISITAVEVVGLHARVLAGVHITQATDELCDLARARGHPIYMEFNNVEMVAYPETKPATLVQHYERVIGVTSAIERVSHK